MNKFNARCMNFWNRCLLLSSVNWFSMLVLRIFILPINWTNTSIFYIVAFIISSNYAHNWTKGLQPKHRVALLFFSLFSSENINRKKLQERHSLKHPNLSVCQKKILEKDNSNQFNSNNNNNNQLCAFTVTVIYVCLIVH